MSRRHSVRRTGSSSDKGRSEFAMRVSDAFDIPRRDRVAVAGILERGELPPPGTKVVFSAAGHEPVTAVIAGGAAFDVPPPKLSFLVTGVTAAEIAVNSRVTPLAAVEIS